ncbi:hypothetical protein HK405_007159, partial [Cladochytrium tenue]
MQSPAPPAAHGPPAMSSDPIKACSSPPLPPIWRAGTGRQSGSSRGGWRTATARRGGCSSRGGGVRRGCRVAADTSAADDDGTRVTQRRGGRRSEVQHSAARPARPFNAATAARGVAVNIGAHPLVKQLIKGAPAAAAAPSGTALLPPAAAAAAAAAADRATEVRIEDLDEAQLKRSKVENEWYRNEIATTQRDSADYIEYLRSNETRKKATIEELQDARRRDQERFATRRRAKEAENATKIEEMKTLIQDLELRLEAKQQDMMSMSDIIVA